MARRLPSLSELLVQTPSIRHPHARLAELRTLVLDSADNETGLSCLKSGILCVYAAPETKILHARQALPQAQSCFHVFEIETKNQQRRFDFELVKPKSAAELRTAANVYQTLCRLQPSDIPFDTPSDKAAFGFVSPLYHLRRLEPAVLPVP